jgi:hypothetical protein
VYTKQIATINAISSGITKIAMSVSLIASNTYQDKMAMVLSQLPYQYKANAGHGQPFF